MAAEPCFTKKAGEHPPVVCFLNVGVQAMIEL